MEIREALLGLPGCSPPSEGEGIETPTRSTTASPRSGCSPPSGGEGIETWPQTGQNRGTGVAPLLREGRALK